MPTTEKHAAVDWNYDYDYVEHATQHPAEHATQHIIAEHATHGNVTQSATMLAQLNATAVHYNRNTGTQELAPAPTPAHRHTGTTPQAAQGTAGAVTGKGIQKNYSKHY